VEAVGVLRSEQHRAVVRSASRSSGAARRPRPPSPTPRLRGRAAIAHAKTHVLRPPYVGRQGCACVQQPARKLRWWLYVLLYTPLYRRLYTGHGGHPKTHVQIPCQGLPQHPSPPARRPAPSDQPRSGPSRVRRSRPWHRGRRGKARAPSRRAASRRRRPGYVGGGPGVGRQGFLGAAVLVWLAPYVERLVG
jgi:hypothetical protein